MASSFPAKAARNTIYRNSYLSDGESPPGKGAMSRVQRFEEIKEGDHIMVRRYQSVGPKSMFHSNHFDLAIKDILL